MSQVPEVGRIQVEQDLNLLRKEWRFQRIGWVAMLVFVLLGFAGALGRGPLADSDVGDPATLALSYDRIVRHGADTRLELTAGPRLDGDPVRIFFSAKYLDSFEILGIIPQPVSSGMRGDDVYYDFPRDSLRTTVITLHLDARGYWFARARIAAGNARPLEFRQLILP